MPIPSAISDFFDGELRALFAEAARVQAEKRHHTLDTPHILYAMLSVQSGLTALGKILEIDTARPIICRMMEQILPSAAPRDELGASAQQVVANAIEIAREHGVKTVGVIHVLLSFLRPNKGTDLSSAGTTLSRLGVTYENARKALLRK